MACMTWWPFYNRSMSLSYSHIMNHCIFKFKRIILLSSLASLYSPSLCLDVHIKTTIRWKRGYRCFVDIVADEGRRQISKLIYNGIRTYGLSIYLYCFSNLLGQKLQVYWPVYMKLDHHSNLHELNKFASFFCRVYGYIYDSFEQFFFLVTSFEQFLTISCSTCNYSSSCRNKFYLVIFRIYLFESFLALDFNNTSECIYAKWFC